MGMSATDTNLGYIALPDFLLITGTVGDPKPDKKKMLVLAAAAGKGIINAIPGSSSTGNLIKEGLNLFGGKSSNPNSTTNQPAAATNQPATATNRNPNLLNDALDIFNRKKK
jgi:hypothetical protein